MTPKEKATKLYNKYFDRTIKLNNAKQCALIAVDEILDSIKGFNFSMNYILIRDYWLEVKQEIENYETRA